MAGIVRARFPHVRIVPNPARHIPGGLNAALGAASHETVLRCDARCELAPDYVRKAVATLARSGAAAAGGRQLPVGEGPFTRAVALAMGMRLGAGGARYRIGGREGPADTVWPGAYRREALLAAGSFDESLRRNEDYALHWRLRELGHTVWFDPRLHAGYRPRENLPALARQSFANGWWKLRMLRRHPRSLRARQLAPPALALGLAASAGRPPSVRTGSPPWRSPRTWRRSLGPRRCPGARAGTLAPRSSCRRARHDAPGLGRRLLVLRPGLVQRDRSRAAR